MLSQKYDTMKEESPDFQRLQIFFKKCNTF